MKIFLIFDLKKRIIQKKQKILGKNSGMANILDCFYRYNRMLRHTNFSEISEENEPCQVTALQVNVQNATNGLSLPHTTNIDFRRVRLTFVVHLSGIEIYNPCRMGIFGWNRGRPEQAGVA